MDLGQLGAAIVAAFVVHQLVEALVKPLWERLGRDPFWLLYLSVGIGGPLAWFTGLNALPVFGEAPLVGRVLTCLAVGLGPSFLHDLVDGKPETPQPR